MYSSTKIISLPKVRLDINVDYMNAIVAACHRDHDKGLSAVHNTLRYMIDLFKVTNTTIMIDISDFPYISSNNVATFVAIIKTFNKHNNGLCLKVTLDQKKFFGLIRFDSYMDFIVTTAFASVE